MKASNIIIEDQRLLILKSLLDSHHYSQNEEVLLVLLEQYGHFPSHELLRLNLCFLEEKGLLVLSMLDELLVAKLTRQGVDVAQGRTIVEGVKRPRPEW